MVQTRALTLLAMLIPAALVLLSLTVTDDASGEMGPMVDRPSGFGPMTVGHVDDVIRCSTKTYDTQLRIYYPADDHGMGAAPNASGAPYMTVVWMPFFGGPYDILDYQGEHLASYGAVVVAFGVNWNDFQFSGNAADINDLLDYLEELNVTSGSNLFGMIDEEAFGICGHSSGGGKSLIAGAQVGRIRAVQAFGAAIGLSTVDIIAPMFAGRPVLLQVGKEDAAYIANSRRAYEKIGTPCSLAETIDGHHSGPFQDHMYVAFYLYHLAGDAQYYTFLYGDEAVAVVAEGLADVYFKLGGDHFFPPELTTSVSARYTPMDTEVTLNVSIRGYQRANDRDLVHGWDVDGDGDTDVRPGPGPNATHVFTAPGSYDVTYNYTLGRWSLLGTARRVDVSNVEPTAVAGPDVQVDHDGYADLDGGASSDTASDVDHLLYKWTFSDGTGTNVTAHPTVSRQFTTIGVIVATLTVYDPHGGMATDTLEVTVVNVPPTASTGAQLTVSEDSAVTLDGTGDDTPSHLDDLEYRWTFGDDMSTGWMPSPETTHAYTRSGNYTATLYVRDPEGDTGEVTTRVHVVNEAPIGEIVYPISGSSFDKEVPLEFSAVGTDTASDQVDLLFKWDFGDGGTSDWLGRRDTQMFYTYASGGVVVVTLTVMDTDGAAHITTSTITIINTPPEVQITRPSPSSTVVEDTTVTFHGRGSDTPGDQSGLEYEWVIDGTTYPGDDVDHTFDRAGTYEALFRVTDPDGASTTLQVEVTVENMAPEITLTLDRTSIETGGSVNFSVEVYDTPSDMGEHFITWEFGDGGTSHEYSGIHAFPSNGTYVVRVTVEDDDGAIAIASTSVTVTDPPKAPEDPTDDDPSPDDGVGNTIYLVAGVLAAALMVVVLVFYLMRRDGGTGLADELDAEPPSEGPDQG